MVTLIFALFISPKALPSLQSKWYSKQHSTQRKKYKKAHKNSYINLEFSFPRPTKSKKEDALGRLFLCLDL
jgi:hypothetical protein